MTPFPMPVNAPPIELPIDPHSEYGKLLSHPRVREFLQKAMLRIEEIQAADRKEIESQVLDALWRRRLDADPPNNLPRIIALARKVLHGKVVDFYRDRDEERDHLVDPPMPEREDGREGAPDGKDQPNYVEEVMPPRAFSPADTHDAGEQLAFVQEKLADGTLTHDDIEVMQAEHAGEKTLDELAKERGVKPATLRQRLHRIREKMNEQWNVRSTRVIVLTIVMLLLLVTLAVAVAGRTDPPPPQPHQERTLQWAPRGAAPVEPPPAPGIGDKPSTR